MTIGTARLYRGGKEVAQKGGSNIVGIEDLGNGDWQISFGKRRHK